MSKIVYLFDENNAFSGVYEAQESPLEEGVYITPVLSTDIEPPSFTEKQTCHFVNGRWVVENKPVEIPPQPSAEEIAREAIIAKQNALFNITVTTSTGKTFDGDEVSRSDMVSAILIANFTGLKQTEWKLADNSTQVVTLDELQEALRLALTEKGKIVGAIV